MEPQEHNSALASVDEQRIVLVGHTQRDLYHALSVACLTGGIIALVIGGLVVASLIILRLHDNIQQLQVIGAIFGFLTPTIASLIDILKTNKLGQEVNSVKENVITLKTATDGKMSALLDKTAEAAVLAERGKNSHNALHIGEGPIHIQAEIVNQTKK